MNEEEKDKVRKLCVACKRQYSHPLYNNKCEDCYVAQSHTLGCGAFTKMKEVGIRRGRLK